MASVAAGCRSVGGDKGPLPVPPKQLAACLPDPQELGWIPVSNGPALSCLVCRDLWLHLYANTNNLLLS